MSKPLRWLRPGGAALLLGALIVGWSAISRPASAGPIVFPSEMGEVLFPEYILVVDAAPKPKKGFSLVEGCSEIVGGIINIFLVAPRVAVGGQNELIQDWLDRNVLTIVGRISPDLKPKTNPQNDGWRFAVVRNVIMDASGVIARLKARINEDISPFYSWYMLGSSDSGLGGICSGSKSSFKEVSLRDKDGQLKEQGDDSQQSEKPSPQIGISFFVGLAFFLLSYVSGFFGGQRLNDKRKLFGAALVGCSFLFLGLSLILLTFNGRPF